MFGFSGLHQDNPLEVFECRECGSPYLIDRDNNSRHVDADGRIDDCADADHTAYGGRW